MRYPSYRLWRAETYLLQDENVQEIFLLQLLPDDCEIRITRDQHGGVDITTQHGNHRERLYFSQEYPHHRGTVRQEEL